MEGKIFKKPQLRSKYMERWYEILCNTSEREEEFIERFYENNGWILKALYNYRIYQIQQGRGQNITPQELSQTREEDELIHKLEEMFLYPIYKSTLKLIRETFINYEELLELHSKYTEYPLEKIIVEYRNNFIY